MVMDLATKQSTPLLGGQNGAGRGGAGAAHWSPDGKWIAYQGAVDGQAGLCIAQLGGASTFLAPMTGTNAPLPGTGNHISWSPDSKQIAYVSATPGPEQSANGDPHVISRYLYKPTASEGVNPYNDNARLHIFVVDIASKKITQLTERRPLRALRPVGAQRRRHPLRVQPPAQPRSGLQLRHPHHQADRWRHSPA